ncbi:MAG: response regulator [Treponema sp.]|jgi:signal transduction histidine kinase/DNA-binding response OmpR family regulator/PAS domain-containing protein|nr:response regulator [Treponema sp.]
MPNKPIDTPIDADRLRIILAASGTGLWDWCINEDIAYYSDEWLAIVGMPAGVFDPHIGFRLERIHPDDAAYVKSEFDILLRGETQSAPYIDFRMKRSNGSWAQVRETVSITERDPSGRPTGLTGMMRDNTAAKMREKRLEDECRYHISIEDMTGLVSWEWDIVTNHLTFRQWYSLTNSDKPNPLEGKTSEDFLQLIHPDDVIPYWQNMTKYLKRNEGGFEYVLRMMGLDKQYMWVILHATIVERDDFGKPTKLIGSTRDIDQKVRAESALRAALEETISHRERLMADIERAEETRRSMFKNSPYKCIMFDSTFHVLDCNPTTLTFFGFTSVEDFRRDFVSLMETALAERQPDGTPTVPLSDRLASAVRDGSHEFETTLILNNKPCPISVVMKKVNYMDSFAIMIYFVDLRKHHEMISALTERDRLLSTLNKMSVILMSSDKDISAVLQDTITELGMGANADIAYILRNREVDGVTCCSSIVYWTTMETPDPPVDIPYDILIPSWRDTLAKGNILNIHTREIYKDPDAVPRCVTDVKAALIIPLFIKNTFWGAVGLSRFNEDRPFIKAEEDLLQSAAILIASAILRASMTEDLLEANRAAIAGTRAKTDFLSRMSHEIRTPMNAIIGMTTLAQKASDMKRVQYCIKQIENSSRQLLGIINDVLDMSKIEANKLEILREAFQFEDMIQHVVNVVQVKMDEKGQDFHVNIENVFTRTVISDELRLSQVLINLLTNAVKFTPDCGKISLLVRQMPIDADTARLHIEVVDTGIGITHEQKPRLFHLFEQAENNTTRKYGGTGLGLSISKSIVNLMGGDIWIEDNPGGGSRFVFEIIIQWGKVCRTDKLPKGLCRDLRILVVDDDVETLDYFESILESFSLACDRAESGVEAVDRAKVREQEGRPYDLVFLDWKMPGMDGCETAREIKRSICGNPIIIMISSASQNEVSSALASIGVTRFLPKPILPSTLYNTIITSMGYDQRSAGRDESGIPAYDWSDRTLLLVEDVEVNREVVIGILEDTGITIEYAENGMRAVERFREHDYNIVLMDIQMPGMDGFDATRVIRSLKKANAASCPIIAMTANAFKEDVHDCLAAGMNGHIAKPIDIEQLFTTLAEYLSPTES